MIKSLVPSPPRSQFTPIKVKKRIVGPFLLLDRQRLCSSRKPYAAEPSSAASRPFVADPSPADVTPPVGPPSDVASPLAACWNLCPRLVSIPSSPIFTNNRKRMAHKRKAEAGPEGGRGKRADEILSSDAQVITGMVNVGEAWSALWSDISAYSVKERITGMKSCGAERCSALDERVIAHQYFKRLKRLFDSPSTIGNDDHRTVKFLCSNTLK